MDCVNTETKQKKCNALTCVKGVLIFIGSYITVNTIIGLVLSLRCAAKIKKTEQANNLLQSCFLHSDSITLKPDTQNAYINVMSSCMDITVPKPENDCMNIEINSFVGKVALHLPEGVAVCSDGSDHFVFSQEAAEEGPVINLVIHDRLTILTID